MAPDGRGAIKFALFGVASIFDLLDYLVWVLASFGKDRLHLLLNSSASNQIIFQFLFSLISFVLFVFVFVDLYFCILFECKKKYIFVKKEKISDCIQEQCVAYLHKKNYQKIARFIEFLIYFARFSFELTKSLDFVVFIAKIGKKKKKIVFMYFHMLYI